MTSDELHEVELDNCVSEDSEKTRMLPAEQGTMGRSIKLNKSMLGFHVQVDENEEYVKHTLPVSPSFWDYTLFYPKSAQSYFKRLSRTFGWRYVAMVMAVYGIQQGWAQSWGETAVYWYLLDPQPKGLGWTNTTFTVVTSFALIPWQLKALFGLVSDMFPIKGFHRSPYIILAASVGTIAYLGLAAFPPTEQVWVGVLLLLTNLSMASPDVMIDGSVAEMCKRHPHYATDLQTLCWGSYFFFSCLASQSGGYLQQHFGSRFLFFCLVGTSLVVLYPAARGWLGERRHRAGIPRRIYEVEGVEVIEDQAGGVSGTTPEGEAADPSTGLGWAYIQFRDPVKGPVFCLAIYISVCSLAQGFIGNAVGDMEVAVVGVVTLVAVSAGIWYWQVQVSTTLAKASLFTYLTGTSQLSSRILSVWYKETNDPGDKQCGFLGADEDSMEHQWYEDKWCHACSADREYLEGGHLRPCFDAPFLAWMAVLGSMFGFLGTILYNKHFASWSYKRIFTFTQLLIVVVNFSDLVWVKRWNVSLGIDDSWFMVGMEVFGPIVNRLQTMPFIVLSAQLCPDEVEATLFALLMGISNISMSTGSYIGVGIVALLDSYSPDFSNLSTFTIIRTSCALFPLALIPFLIPNGSPSSTMADMQKSKEHKQECELTQM